MLFLNNPFCPRLILRKGYQTGWDIFCKNKDVGFRKNDFYKDF